MLNDARQCPLQNRLRAVTAQRAAGNLRGLNHVVGDDPQERVFPVRKTLAWRESGASKTTCELDSGPDMQTMAPAVKAGLVLAHTTAPKISL
jgi:hypothetical protein